MISNRYRLYRTYCDTNNRHRCDYVLNLEAAIAQPAKYGMVPNGPNIVLLGSMQSKESGSPVLAVPCTVLFIQKRITNAPASHFLLYYGDSSLAYNPLPDYMIEGLITWYYYGIKF